MGFSIGVHPPKTPITKGSHGVGKNTIPNICKMPGPPAPFVPSPLPNIAKSELSPKGYSTTVKMEGQTVAIRGATFESIGDMASKGTGGGLISANTHGPAKFITPGSLTVKIEGKNVHLKSDPVLNNCGPSGSPPNTGATMMGMDNPTASPPPPLSPEQLLKCIACACDSEVNQDQPDLSCMKAGAAKHDCCEKKIGQHKKSGSAPKVDGEHGYNAGTPVTGIVGSRAANFSAGTLPKGSMWPDAAALTPDGRVEQFFDFKFKCKTAKYAGPPGWTKTKKRNQFKQYLKLSRELNPDSMEPKIVHNLSCPPNHACP